MSDIYSLANVGITERKAAIVTERKAAIVAKLDQMRSNGWKELEGMTGAELAALHDEVDESAVILEGIDSQYNRTRFDAYAAIKNERGKREQAAFASWREQQTRNANIAKAAENIREAIKMIDIASDIPDLSQEPPAPPTLDVASATDDELSSARAECLQILQERPSRAGEDARAIAAIHTNAAKAIRKELETKSRAEAERRDAAQSIISTIDAEQARREAERAAEEEALRPRTLLERIEAIESQLAGKGA